MVLLNIRRLFSTTLLIAALFNSHALMAISSSDSVKITAYVLDTVNVSLNSPVNNNLSNTSPDTSIDIDTDTRIDIASNAVNSYTVILSTKTTDIVLNSNATLLALKDLHNQTVTIQIITK